MSFSCGFGYSTLKQNSFIVDKKYYKNFGKERSQKVSWKHWA